MTSRKEFVLQCKVTSTINRSSETRMLFFFRSVLVQVHADVIFSRETSEGVSHVPGYFHTAPQIVSEGHYLDVDSILSNLNVQVYTFNSRGSGYVLEGVTRFVLSVCRYRPLHGSSYIKTPHFLIGKHCIVNVVNNDQMCFKWAILSDRKSVV